MEVFDTMEVLRKSWKLSNEYAATLPAFHAITGSDTTSYLAGDSKATAFQASIESLGTNKCNVHM